MDKNEKHHFLSTFRVVATNVDSIRTKYLKGAQASDICRRIFAQSKPVRVGDLQRKWLFTYEPTMMIEKKVFYVSIKLYVHFTGLYRFFK